MTTIDNNNYELWLLRYAEGELTAAECKAVEAWLASHSEAAEELALYSEAPRLERDESVRYAAAPQPHTQSLWPVLLRWSVAAAVVVALMMPALRMGTMEPKGSIESVETPLVAEARPLPTEAQPAPKNIKAIKKASAPSVASISSASSISSISSASSTRDTLAQEEPVFSVEIVEISTLIVFEDSSAKAAPVETESLIVYDRSADWGDMLLVANDAYRDGLSNRPLGRLVSRALPDSRQLAENFVEPMREKIDNIKSKIK